MMTRSKFDPNLDPNPITTPPTITAGQSPPLRKRGALASAALTALAAMFKTRRHHVHRWPPSPCRSCNSRARRRHLGVWASGEPFPSRQPWAVNPASFMWGWVCWGNGNKILGEKLVSISQPLPDVTALPDKGFPWQEQMAVNLKCISGTDAGTEVGSRRTPRRQGGSRRTDRGGARPPQRRQARRQSLADRAA